MDSQMLDTLSWAIVELGMPTPDHKQVLKALEMTLQNALKVEHTSQARQHALIRLMNVAGADVR